jgi:2-polyprenyl-3-methyl-5-hydroxy-6-metoxy-1,4-benzoquinol methylase
MSKSKFAQRSSGVEIMDDLNCKGEVVDQTLRELEFINRTLGGNAVTVNGVKELLREKNIEAVSIMDLGCGGGDMLKLLKHELKVKASFIGIDANPNIVVYATQNNADSSISFETVNILSDEFSALTCYITIATLFFHHFDDDQLAKIFKQLQSQSRIGIVINDLHRHPLAYYSIKLLTRLFSKSSMVKYDAPLSVLRGFTKRELRKILSRAGITKYHIRWKWAFRWQIVIS